VHVAELRLGRDLDLQRDALLEARRLAVHRYDCVRVRRVGLRAVVGPLETLYRVVECREALARCRIRLGLPKRLQALQPDRVALAVVVSLEGEAAATGPPGRGEIEPEEDNVRPGDGVDRQPGVLLAAAH
jgi:hypothetical protein